jgi:hypothetical protein
MCVFPKDYKYGNDNEPWMYPFKRDGDTNDFNRPNYEFFQNFDKRITQLLELGIQANVILFNPYDNVKSRLAVSPKRPFSSHNPCICLRKPKFIC